MAEPEIRCALTCNGDIEAAMWSSPHLNLVIDRRTGAVIKANVKEGSDEFRWLVRAARKHLIPTDYRNP